MTDASKETRLWIFHRGDKGELRCDSLFEGDFATWLRERTDGVSPQYHPRFIGEMPDENAEGHVHCIIRGKVVIPTPVSVVTEYRLPDVR